MTASDAPDLEEANEMSELASFAKTSRRTYEIGLLNLTALIIVFFVLLGQTMDIDEDVDEIEEILESSAMATTTSLPGFQDITWDQLELRAKTQELNFYLWSPEGTSPRKWVDNTLRPNLADNFGIVLNRIDAVYQGCDIAGMKLVCDVRDEQQDGKRGGARNDGSVDLVWINGVNFREMKARNLLYGPFATSLPNSANFDFTDSAIAIDKGTPIGGYEMPFNQAQSVFLYNSNQVATPPDTIAKLFAWMKVNPNKFIYSNPPTDFTGSAFIRTCFYHFAGPWEDFLGPFNEELYLERVPALWEALRDIAPSLYMGGNWYPESHQDIRPLVANETLLLDFSMSAFEAAQQKASETNPWPDTMDSYLLSTGTIADTNYLAIPVNAPNKEAALVAINHIASAGAMFVRATPQGWGTLQAFDPQSPSIKEWDPAFDYILRDASVPSEEELAAARLGDLHSDYVNRLNADWVTFVRDYVPPQ